ncbi:MAG: rRNA synthase [Candidatus Binatota bacterium]|nr:rRNA synthase [Candidatus Binatota bacterium]
MRPPIPPTRPERLQKVLASAGIASRRSAEELIRSGRVSVNGAVVTELGVRADPIEDDVRLDGERVRPSERAYLLMHKPDGVVTTLDDPEGRPTVAKLLPRSAARVFPVGRLDFHSSGLLLLTNDGELAMRLMHPRYRIPRTYRVKVRGRPSAEAVARLRKGVKLEEGVTGPAQVELEIRLPKKSWLRITIREGRRREIRRMCEAVGFPVERLVRVRFGPLGLGQLRAGEIRELTSEEVERLRQEVGLIPRQTKTARRRRTSP